MVTFWYQLTQVAAKRMLLYQHINNNNNNNTHGYIYSSVIMIVGVQLVHLMNIEQCQVAADPQTKPRDLGCESACFR